MKKKTIIRAVIVCFIVGVIVYNFYPRKIGNIIKCEKNKWTNLCIMEDLPGEENVHIKDKALIQKILDYVSGYKVKKPIILLEPGDRIFDYNAYLLTFSNKKDTLIIELLGSRYVRVYKKIGDAPSVYKYANKDMNFDYINKAFYMYFKKSR